MQEREYLQKEITPGTNLSWGADGKTLNADVPSIEANPQDTATDTLNKLELDGTVYELAGGTEVEANPADPATDTLSTIDIAGTVYNIEGGGGGGSSTLVDLTDVNIDNPTEGQGLIYDATNQKWINGNVGGGGGGSGSGYTETELWSGSATITRNAEPFTIPNVDSDIFDEYDELIFETQHGDGSSVIQNKITTNFFKEHQDITIYGHGRDMVSLMRCVSYEYISNDDVIKVYCETNYSIVFLKLIGVKYGGGGTTNLYGDEPPTSAVGEDGALYLQYEEGETIETNFDTLFSGDLYCSTWANPVLVPNVNPNLYNKLKFTGTYAEGVELLVSDIAIEPQYTQLSTNINYMWIYISSDGTQLYMTSGTGYGSHLTRVDGTTLITYPTKITDIYGKIEDEWRNLPSKALYSTNEPVSKLGSNGELYLQYQDGSTPIETEYETAWSGTATVTAWASPHLLDFDASQYYRLKVTNASTETILFEDIPIYGDSERPDGWVLRQSPQASLYKNPSDNTKLILYGQTGYSYTLTEILGTKMEGAPAKINEVYSKINDEWLTLPSGNLYGITDPSSSIGKDGSLYSKCLPEEEIIDTIFQGSSSSSAYASPIQIPINTGYTTEYTKFAFTYTYAYGNVNTTDELTYDVLDDELTHFLPSANDQNYGAQAKLIISENKLYLYPSTGYNLTITKITGTRPSNKLVEIEKVFEKIDGKWLEIKTGSSDFNGGSTYKETVLWTGCTNSGSYTLDTPITDFDAVIAYGIGYMGNNFANSNLIIPVFISISNIEYGYQYMANGSWSSERRAYITFTDSTHFSLGINGGSAGFFKLTGINFGNGGAVFKGLDYSRAVDLSLPDNTGYNYTPTEDGALMVTSYGQVGGVIVSNVFANENIFLSHIPDRQTTAWCFVEKGVQLLLRSTSVAHTWPSDSWFKFIPLKQEGNALVNYSTTEQRIGTWIDGKPLYEITLEYTVTNQGASAAFDITTDMPITNTVRSCEYEFDYTYQGTQYALVNSPLIYYNRAGNTNNMKFNMGSGTLSGDLIVTFRYTKTTD